MKPTRRRRSTRSSATSSFVAIRAVGLAILLSSIVACAGAVDSGTTTTTTTTAAALGIEERTILDILQQVAAHQEEKKQNEQDRPFVSLCFAQTLDGKFALYTNDNDANDDDNRDGNTRKSTSSNHVISGAASMRLTHGLRSVHDGILVGGRTLSIDNPRLSNRLWHDLRHHQPRPVVLDPHLRHLHRLGSSRKVQNVIVCCAADHVRDMPQQDVFEAVGSTAGDVTLLPCKTTHNGHLDLADVLAKLKRQFGMQSLMVEGGPTVLNIFIKAQLFDCVCITIGPRIWGNGIALTEPCDLGAMGELHYYRLEDDLCLVCCPPTPKAEETR